jgi:hypothetical protein
MPLSMLRSTSDDMWPQPEMKAEKRPAAPIIAVQQSGCGTYPRSKSASDNPSIAAPSSR